MIVSKAPESEDPLGHVFVVEDDAVLQKQIADLLRFSGYRVYTWHRAQDFLDEIPDVEPVVLLTDMRLPGISGCDLHFVLHQLQYDMPVIYISGESTVPQTVQAMKQGPLDFLLKPFGRNELLASVAAGIRLHKERKLSLVLQAQLKTSLAALSPRQKQVANLLSQGYGNREIVEALHISVATAKQYKSEVMEKLGVSSLSKLISLLNPQYRGSSSNSDR